MISIIPKPDEGVIREKNTVELPKQVAVATGEFEEWVLESFCDRTGCTVAAGKPWLVLNKELELPEEGYRLCVDESGIQIYAAQEAGVLWALTTLVQICDENGRIPVCKISDKPRYPHRGLNLDCVRHFFSVETVKQVIEQISMVKMNVLHWHLTDDQAWRIESKVYPQLHQSSNEYYTQEQIREVVHYAKLRGVEVIPEIELPGHVTGILSVFPQYSCSGKAVDLVTCGGIFSFVLCAGKEETYRFLETLLDEICPLFPSRRFHIGGDEAPKTNWKTCPDCQKKMQEENLSKIENLQGYFTKRVARILEKHGKQIICWNDALNAAIMPDDFMVQYWTVQHLASMKPYLASGKPFIYSDMYDMYLDYPHSMISLKKIYTSRWKIGNKSSALAAGMKGIEACCWTERIPHSTQLFLRLFPRVIAVAETAWTDKRNYREFRHRLHSYIKKLENQKITCTAENWWNPAGKARFRESISYVRQMFPEAYQDIQEQTADIQEINAAFLKAMLKGFFAVWDRPKVIRALSEKKE